MCGVTILFSSFCLERVFVPWQAYACFSKCLHDMAGSITWGVIESRSKLLQGGIKIESKSHE